MADLGATEQDVLVRRVLALLADHACAPCDLAAQLGVPQQAIEDLWRTVSALRRCQGRPLVALPPDIPCPCGDALPCLRGWYAPTARLATLLERFQLNEALAGHYGAALVTPEGGHFELSLASTEVNRLMRYSCASFDTHRMAGVCIGAYEPSGDVETLAANVGRVLLHIEDYRRQPFTVEFVEGLYADLVRGVDLEGLGCAGRPDDEGRAGALAALCAALRGGEARAAGAPAPACGPAPACEIASAPAPAGTLGTPAPAHHTLVAALVAWCTVVTARPFPVGNELLAYVLYFLVLHRAGYHVSAHVPLTPALGLDCLDEPGPAAVGPLGTCGAPGECGGSFDWTAWLEHTVARLVDGQTLIIDHLDGMARRRARIRSIVAADETLNARQQDVLVEAMLHSNAEFSYAVHEKRYGVSYLCARSDLARFLDMGLFRCCDDGVRHFFIAAEGFQNKAWSYLKARCPQEYARFYDEDGSLRPAFRAEGHAPDRFNRDVGFYEPELMEDVWMEHYAHRRLSIVDEDGLRRRGGSVGPSAEDRDERGEEGTQPR